MNNLFTFFRKLVNKDGFYERYIQLLDSSPVRTTMMIQNNPGLMIFDSSGRSTIIKWRSNIEQGRGS